VLRLLAPAILLILLAGAATAAEAPQSAGDYRQLCTGKAAEVNRSLCVGFITGADQAYALEQKTAGFRKDFCVPAGTGPEQLTRVWMSFLNQHPEMAHGPAVASYFRALARAYPCAD